MTAFDKWKDRFLDECPSQWSEAVLRAGQPVQIRKNNELGPTMWAVELDGGFWMDAFSTEADARQFVKDMGWPEI